MVISRELAITGVSQTEHCSEDRKDYFVDANWEIIMCHTGTDYSDAEILDILIFNIHIFSLRLTQCVKTVIFCRYTLKCQ